MKNSDFRVTIDNRNEKIGKKIRDAAMLKIPYMLIIGEKEVNEANVSIRKRGAGDLGGKSIKEFIQMLKDELENS